MEKNKPFEFGKISQNTEPTGKQPQQKIKRELTRKQKNNKIIITEKQIDNITDGYYCKDRVEHNLILCSNETCNCQFKKYRIEDVKLHINKSIIQEYYKKNNIKNKYHEYRSVIFLLMFHANQFICIGQFRNPSAEFPPFL
jgi:hypothetical protein